MEKERKYRPKRRRRRGGDTAAITFVLVVLSIATVVCVVMFFPITDITVVGESRYAAQELIEASGIRLDQNILTVDGHRVSESLLKQFPYLEEVRISRVLPNLVEIHVFEAKPAVIIVNSKESYTLLSATGRVLEQRKGVSRERLLLVVGADYSAFPEGSLPGSFIVQGQDPEDTDVAQRCQEIMTIIRQVMRAVEETGFTGIDYIDVSDPLCTFLLYKGRALLKIGSELELSYKLTMASEILKSQLGDKFVGTIDLTFPPHAYILEQDISKLVNQEYWQVY